MTERGIAAQIGPDHFPFAAHLRPGPGPLPPLRRRPRTLSMEKMASAAVLKKIGAARAAGFTTGPTRATSSSSPPC